MNGDGSEAAAILPRPGGATIAYRRLDGREPGVMFLGGFRSDMTGTKAIALEAACRAAGRTFVRFDYSGHGESSGDFLDGTIGSWRDDAVAVLDEAAVGRQVLVGSSMGGWIMLLAALARPERIAGLVGIAAAPDFTEDLMWNRYGEDMREELKEKGVIHVPSDYDDEDYPDRLPADRGGTPPSPVAPAHRDPLPDQAVARQARPGRAVDDGVAHRRTGAERRCPGVPRAGRRSQAGAGAGSRPDLGLGGRALHLGRELTPAWRHPTGARPDPGAT